MQVKFNSIIVRYGEISLKGKNRIQFEFKLKEDIERFLRRGKIPFSQVLMKRGRMYIQDVGQIPDLKKVLGVYSYSPAIEIARDLELLKQAVKPLAEELKGARSFRVSCQRVDKRFPVKSVDVERDIGTILTESSHTPVKLKDPQIDFQIEIGHANFYIFFEKIKGFSGMPFGSAGQLVSLISSGIDSPVATFLMMKRGVEPILLHFKLSEPDCDKVVELKEKLQEYTAGRELKLIIINRHNLFKGQFEQLYEDPRYHPFICVLCKYLMHKKAGEIIEQEGALGLLTGDNLAQVASQTLKNLLAYRGVSGYPVYSPLISFEKEQTIQLAKQIGTFAISTASTYGCTPPKHPKTGVSPGIFQKILAETGLG